MNFTTFNIETKEHVRNKLLIIKYDNGKVRTDWSTSATVYQHNASVVQHGNSVYRAISFEYLSKFGSLIARRQLIDRCFQQSLVVPFDDTSYAVPRLIWNTKQFTNS